MLDTEGQWSEALASNNIRAIIRWLREFTAEAAGEADVDKILPTFSCWVQRTSEFAKKELLTLCFSRCQGLWMFLDRSSFTRVHLLLQRLRNLLTLAQWARRQLCSAHLWHGVGVPCVVCRDTFGSSDVRRGCWNREHRALKQHIWLGRLVQWWGIMGLLPKYPDAHEVKRISQMWKEMDHSHRKARLETPGCEEGEMERFRSLIQGMVTQLDIQHGCIWTSEDCTDQCYPPPNLQALLKLVLVPHIDNMSVQALLMYFVLDMANFLQCKGDLLQSFCHAFTIPSSFSQQIRAFWMLDHGHIKASMELLLSPRAAAPRLSWQHRCIIHCLLMRKQPQLALRYLHWTRPAIESTEDAKFCADVLLQNSCVPEAGALLKRGHTENDNVVMYFLQACNGFGLCAEALKCIPAGYNVERDIVNGTTRSQLPLIKKGRPPCPLSAKQYQAQRVNTVSPEELVQLVREAVIEVRKPQPKIREVVWPEHTERKSNSREMFLSTQALRHLTPSPSPMNMIEETEQTAHTDEPEEEQPVHNQQPESPEHISSSEDLSSESVPSFTLASSLPLLRQDRPHVYESTLTLQRISSFLTDGENQSREEEEESRTPSSVEALPDCPELTMTLDGATDLVFLSNSAEEGEEDVKTVFSSEDFLSVDAVSGPSMDETIPVNKSCRLYLPPQFYSDEVSQSVPSLCEPQVECHSFLSPDYENMACCKGEEVVHGPPDVTDLWSFDLTLDQEDQPDCIPSQIFSFSEAATPDCFLEEECQKTHEHQQQEEAVECFSQDLSCALSETTVLTDLHQSLLSEHPVASGSGVSVETGRQDISPLTPMWSSIFRTQLPISGSSLTPSLPCNIITTSAPSDTTNESSPISQLKMDEHNVQSTSAWLDHCKMGSWWTQDLETHRASTGLLPASEPGAAIASDTKRASLVLGQPYSHSLVNFMDFSAKQKGDSRDDKQADKEEPAGWSSLGKGSQGAIRSGRTLLRKGKRVKRA
ncbi:uncharacterized protein LOC119504273 isoform X3 [Sebastes umbrosus]|uniref:uncharacterized protein LOC119504273 isoform X3 n=1 Tax=Sebastes umbrosus TaxID=72105 RepID=UPI0018A005BD|nr:uncharacterized protein LOC119504273 isoform X3 [Sebastes umbrosus]